MRIYYNKYISYLLGTLCFSVSLFGQSNSTIHVKKEVSPFLFFQKGIKTDTIRNTQNNVFYLIIPDSLKTLYSFNTENGQLIKSNNDSLVKLNYLPGLKYEYRFELEKIYSEAGIINSKKNIRKKGEFKTLINGTTDLSPGIIRVQIVNLSTLKLLHEINLYYKP